MVKVKPCIISVWVMVEVPTPPKVTDELVQPFGNKVTTLFETDPVMLATLVFVAWHPTVAVPLVQTLVQVYEAVDGVKLIEQLFVVELKLSTKFMVAAPFAATVTL